MTLKTVYTVQLGSLVKECDYDWTRNSYHEVYVTCVNHRGQVYITKGPDRGLHFVWARSADKRECACPSTDLRVRITSKRMAGLVLNREPQEECIHPGVFAGGYDDTDPAFDQYCGTCGQVVSGYDL